MPYLLGSTLVAGGRSVRLAGLPDFNAGEPAFKILAFEGWFDGVAPTPILVASGGGPGAVAVGEWLPGEQFYTLAGRIDCAPDQREGVRSALLASVPYARESVIACLGNDVATDLQVFVRLADKPTIVLDGPFLRFTLPVVAPDPFKYALEPLSAEAGGFTASDWFRTYTDDSGWVRLYVDGARFYQETVEDVSALPKVATLVSPGDVASSRVTFTVTGPLDAGGWWLEDAAGRRLRAEVSLTEGQSVTFDCLNGRAWLDGAPIDHLVYGDFLSLAPGENSYRLVVDETTGAPYMSVAALPAYL